MVAALVLMYTHGLAAKAIVGHTTDRMRQHYSSVGNDEARSIGERVVSLVPSVRGA
jgi:hypothetical protein